ncbi:hypothetical protein [Xenorhabdus sp. KJ12.1]|uniref:hypothetical protein n=1 Tax=Xenorhabdus sp. KJ12.1 TaxID=1851571 RepID=UPI00187C11E7|nr:hypothetical protein [Xenorhabdus sp. KJ12.1]
MLGRSVSERTAGVPSYFIRTHNLQYRQVLANTDPHQSCILSIPDYWRRIFDTEEGALWHKSALKRKELYQPLGKEEDTFS